MRAAHRTPSPKNPTICTKCENIARKHSLGAEVHTALLFADVRGSTTIAETMSATAFTEIMNRFFRIANRILVDRNALIDKMVGDQVIGVFVPALVTSGCVDAAIASARELISATARLGVDEMAIPIGVGIHAGETYIGPVGSDDTATDITVMGDIVNVTARLSSAAAAGEILVSDEAFDQWKGAGRSAPSRLLELKGKSKPVAVRVL